jgi:hypothetical protein
VNWLKKASASIEPVDIYSIFALSLIPPNVNLGEYEAMARFEAQFLRDKFVNVFTALMRKQIAKYLSRPDRYDPQQVTFLSQYPSATPAQLSKMFNTATFRSENHRSYYPDEVYNVQWGDIANAVDNLSKSNNISSIITDLAGQGGLLNLVHNTGTLVLDKLPRYHKLLFALNDCQNSDEQTVINNANPDVKEILRHVA